MPSEMLSHVQRPVALLSCVPSLLAHSVGGSAQVLLAAVHVFWLVNEAPQRELPHRQVPSRRSVASVLLHTWKSGESRQPLALFHWLTLQYCPAVQPCPALHVQLFVLAWTPMVLVQSVARAHPQQMRQVVQKSQSLVHGTAAERAR